MLSTMQINSVKEPGLLPFAPKLEDEEKRLLWVEIKIDEDRYATVIVCLFESGKVEAGCCLMHCLDGTVGTTYAKHGWDNVNARNDGNYSAYEEFAKTALTA